MTATPPPFTPDPGASPFRVRAEKMAARVRELNYVGDELAEAAETLAEGIAAGVNDVPGLLVALETAAARWRSTRDA